MAELRERYDNLDGLRAISCLAIIAMHIEANSSFNINESFRTVIMSWTHFVSLFLIISGFSVFCGYYEKIKTGSTSLNQFYNRRYSKILPFFVTLIIVEVVFEHSITHLMEGFTEATLVFGFLPNNRMSVVGVSWTLGVIFLFYLSFPFFVYLCWNKKRLFVHECG